VLTWIAITFCLTQSAMFSGLNLAFFSITRLRLEVEVSAGSKEAAKVFGLRTDSNFLLTTILWGNVGINVLLTLLSNSMLAGVAAFVFSTVVITFVGEILPQAYFSRHALRLASLLSPVLKFYQFILYPVAKPVALLLDWLIGKEGIQYFREHNLREVIMRHIEADDVDVDHLEGTGALNFLEIDDLMVSQEGESVDPRSVISLDFQNAKPVFPDYQHAPNDPFLQSIHASEKKWVIITDATDQPQLVLDADGFLRAAMFETGPVKALHYCHRPVVVTDRHLPLGEVITKLEVMPEHGSDDVIDHDLILVWAEERRIITGADLLGRLLRGIL
jgi:hypothetical protein